MKIVEEIKKEHDEIRDHILKIENNEEQAAELFKELAVFTLSHHESEEHVVFPELSRKKDVKETKQNLMAEHAAARRTMQFLLALPADDEMWESHFHVVKDLIYHHVEEEENELFEILRDEKDEKEMEELYTRFEEYFEQAEPEMRKKVESGNILKPEDELILSKTAMAGEELLAMSEDRDAYEMAPDEMMTEKEMKQEEADEETALEAAEESDEEPSGNKKKDDKNGSSKEKKSPGRPKKK